MGKLNFKRPAKRIPFFDGAKINNQIAQIKFNEINEQAFVSDKRKYPLTPEDCIQTKPLIVGEIRDVTTTQWLAKRKNK